MCNLADGLIEQGKAEGILIGQAEGKAESILNIFNARDFEVSTVLRDKILSISSINSLEKLLNLAVVCTNIDEFEKNVNVL